ncbi:MULTISPECIES: hypothetical protein [Halobacillus]|uniref:hypothetical protein n=1 Tax=Halobacillus TaxID=45667 RepID=UPI001368DD55|nr:MULTISPECIES: hypothetical protein [Halobacillus]MYL31035.1 hypothetical protein [Halobacillus halophilus]MYL39344.1 hypothetical protein [Halobacillus litoralis]
MERLLQLKKQQEARIQDIREKINAWKAGQREAVICFFTHSIHISHDTDQECMMIASFHIRNLSHQKMHDPYICLKMSEDAPFQFSGKYVHKEQAGKMKAAGAWVRMDEQQKKNEFWLKPLDHTGIEPGGSLTFANFQLKWKHETSYAASVHGYAYGKGWESGVPSLNQMSASGVKGEGE